MIIDDFEKDILFVGPNNKEAVNRICREYMETMRKKYSIYTVRSYCTICRRIVRTHCPPPVTKSAHQILRLESQDYRKIDEEYQKKVFLRSWDQKEGIDPDHFIQICLDQIAGYWETHKSYQRLAIGIAGLTGRRFFSEILGFGRFRIIGLENLHKGSIWKHRIPAHTMMFSGHAKTLNRGKAPYPIPILGNSPELVYHGWRVLREAKQVIPKDFPDEMNYLTRDSYKINIQHHYRLFQKYRDQIIEINRKLKYLNGGATKVLHPIFNRTDLQIKDLRSLYVTTCYKKFKPNTDKNPYISKIFGHHQFDCITAQIYKNFS